MKHSALYFSASVFGRLQTREVEAAGHDDSPDSSRVDEAKVCPGGAGERDEGGRRADEAGEVGAPGRRSW